MQKKNSEKLQIIDKTIFDRISTGSLETKRTIRNAKYRKKQVEFNLMSFVKVLPDKKLVDGKRKIIRVPKRSVIKRGKTRENVAANRKSRLKRTILIHRRFKRDYNTGQIKAEGSSSGDSPLGKTSEGEVSEALESLMLQSPKRDQFEDHPQIAALTIIMAENDTVSKEALESDTVETKPIKTEKCAEILETTEATLHKTKIEVTGVIKHSNNFREYCDNITTSDLRELTDKVLRALNYFQRRAYAKNQIKAQSRPRFVIGFRQVQSCLLIGKVKLVIIATDCEKCPGTGGLDETIVAITKICKDGNVPYMFSLRRRQLAYSLFIKASIGCVGILDHSGMEEAWGPLLIALQKAKILYENAKQ